MSESILAIIGGGRWGQIWLSVAAKLFVPFDRIVVVSQQNIDAVTYFVTKLNTTSHVPIEVVATVDELLSCYSVKAAVVVNAAHQHFDTALILIKSNVHVLIEKPIVSNRQEMRHLITAALQKNVCLVPGLNYRFCSYLKNFSQYIAKKNLPQQFSLIWSDVENEVRNGILKRVDTSISVVEDVMPHVWTILSQVFPGTVMEIQACQQQETSMAALPVRIGAVPGNVFLNRSDGFRKRILTLQYESGNVTLDFSKEPGTIIDGDSEHNADPDWDDKLSPLALQLEYFFKRIAAGKSSQEDLDSCIASLVKFETQSSPVHPA